MEILDYQSRDFHEGISLDQITILTTVLTEFHRDGSVQFRKTIFHSLLEYNTISKDAINCKKI